VFAGETVNWLKSCPLTYVRGYDSGFTNIGGIRQVALRVSKGTVLDIGDEKRETRN
jgi:hypothetical protein